MGLHGRPDRFRLEAAGRGIADAGFATGAVFADDDNDNDDNQDLYVVRHGPNSLYENDARGHFRDVAGLPRTRGRVAVQDARLIRRRPADRILILRERRRGARTMPAAAPRRSSARTVGFGDHVEQYPLTSRYPTRSSAPHAARRARPSRGR